jgi:uncharacterized NAD(P)/FAD-binding protein YdhS
MSQAAFWEITAVPDIRLQTAELARHLRSCGQTAMIYDRDAGRPGCARGGG